MSSVKAAQTAQPDSFDPCLAPPAPDTAMALVALDLSRDGDTLAGGGREVSLTALGLPVATKGDAAASMARAMVALGAGDAPAAAAAFAGALGDATLRGPAAHGLACTLCLKGAFAEAQQLSALIVASGGEHPAYAALAGHASAKLGDPAQTRQYLARAARRARGQPQFRDILHFAQRTLLIQQFGD